MTKPRHQKLRHSMRCPRTRKLGYKSRKLAREARKWSRLLNGEKTSEWSVYRCRYCDYWHIGHNYSFRDNNPEQEQL